MRILDFLFGIFRPAPTVLPLPIALSTEPPRFLPEGLRLIKQFEGCGLVAYQDLKGIWTIGYGHTGPEVIKGLIWNQIQVDLQLAHDVDVRCAAVQKLIQVSVTSSQFTAVVCLVYNIGLGAFRDSAILKKINAKDFAGAADEFIRWNHSDGAVVPGLTRRRMAERNLFIS